MYLTIILFSVCLLTGQIEASRDVPYDYLSLSVLVELENNDTGSGFYIINKESLFFVTARHVLLKEEKEHKFIPKSNTAILISPTSEIQLKNNKEIKLDLVELYNEGCINYNNLYDAVVVKIGSRKNNEINTVKGVLIKQNPGSFVSVASDILKRYEETIIGNEVFVFGYPTSLGIKDMPQVDFSKPLLRKGIIAGKNERTKSIILDCPVYPGNSGSPVVECETNYEGNNPIKKYRLIGLVADFVPFIDEFRSVRYGYPRAEIANSDYSVVIPIDIIIELIEEQK